MKYYRNRSNFHEILSNLIELNNIVIESYRISQVKFGGKKNEKRVTTPESITFHLLHLSLMREYLGMEFESLKNRLPFPYDLEHIIDDWVSILVLSSFTKFANNNKH